MSSTGTSMRTSSSLRTPVSMTVQSRPTPARKRPTSSSGRCVADSPIRCPGRPAWCSSRSSVSARWAPRLVCATAWISSTIAHSTPAKISRAREVSIRESDSGVVIRTSGGVRSIAWRSFWGVSPVRIATETSPPMPRSGARRLRSMSYESAFRGETYTSRVRRSADGSATSRSSAHRNAASVLPEPVGADSSTFSPRAIAGQAWSCASVGRSKARRNQSRTCGVNEASGSVFMAPRQSVGPGGSRQLLHPSERTGTLAAMSSSPADEHTRSLTVVEHVALSDVGREREGNEDAHLELPPLFVVADGMGGAQAGEVASGIVVETFGAAFEKRGLPDGLAAAIERANARIHAMAQEDKALAGMGTTTTAAWVGGRSLLLAHVGDSRAYRLRDGRLEQLTDDHSLVGGLVR